MSLHLNITVVASINEMFRHGDIQKSMPPSAFSPPPLLPEDITGRRSLADNTWNVFTEYLFDPEDT